MNEFDFKPNSHKSKAEQSNAVPEKRVEKVITGTAKIKKNDMRRLADVFISEDVKNVKSYVLMDVLVPTIKKAIVDIVTDGVNMIFFGGAAPRRGATGASFIDYSGRSTSQSSRVVSSTPSVRSRHTYDDVVVPTRADAERVLKYMYDLVREYGQASILDLYDAVGVTREFTDCKYGWTMDNIRDAEILRVSDGYWVKMPKAVSL